MINNYKLIYSFDFDGTIVTNKFPEIGDQIKETIDFIKKVKNDGNYIILNTMREGDCLNDAIQFCKTLGIEFDAVNDNLPHMKDFYNNNPRKIFANYYIDDHNMFLEGVNKKKMNEIERIDSFLSFMKNNVTDDMLYWLKDNGFFTAPASTKYHGDYEGGLFDHSLAVAQELVYLTEQLKITWQDPRSPFIVGMFHDLCKIDIYKRYPSIDPKKEYDFTYDDKSLLNGHGAKSVMMLSQWYKLTEEEILCIRYHMGAYETEDWDKYGKSIEKYPNVLFTHTADMIASRIRGV